MDFECQNDVCAEDSKRARFFCVWQLFLSVVCLMYSTSTFAREFKSRPYKASTVDECIYEKECVLWAFERAIKRPHYNNHRNAVIKKWENDINILTLGDQEKLYKNYLQKISERLVRHFPHKFNLDTENANVTLLISTDFSYDLFVTYRTIFEDLFLQNLFNAFKNDVHIGDSKVDIYCRSFPFFDNSGKIFRTAMFVNDKGNQIEKCFDSTIFFNLGFTSTNFAFPQFPSDDYDSLNDLHLFLIHLMYQTKITGGMTFKEALQVIESDYYTALQEFIKIRNLNIGDKK